MSLDDEHLEEEGLIELEGGRPDLPIDYVGMATVIGDSRETENLRIIHRHFLDTQPYFLSAARVSDFEEVRKATGHIFSTVRLIGAAIDTLHRYRHHRDWARGIERFEQRLLESDAIINGMLDCCLNDLGALVLKFENEAHRAASHATRVPALRREMHKRETECQRLAYFLDKKLGSGLID
jgi:hypothetical protein